jgi:hypothetical protein
LLSPVMGAFRGEISSGLAFWSKRDWLTMSERAR